MYNTILLKMTDCHAMFQLLYVTLWMSLSPWAITIYGSMLIASTKITQN